MISAIIILAIIAALVAMTFWTRHSLRQLDQYHREFEREVRRVERERQR